MDIGGRGGTALSLDTFSNLFSSAVGNLKRKATTTTTMEQGQGIEFPITLACRSDGNENDENRRVVVGEMDFFSGDKKAPVQMDLKMPTTGLTIKKEHLTLNTGLNLLTTNTGSDESTVDEGMSPKVDDKEGKSELAALQAELQQMNEENQRLRGMLNQVTANYSTLQMQFYNLMQQRNLRIPTPTAQEATSEKADAKSEVLIPRQFMDLRAPAGADAEETSNSSTEVGSGRERSSSPANKDILIPFDNDRSSAGREGSPQNSSQAWGPNKMPKLAVPSKSAEQPQEATLRKARVSVRARSEAPMISDGCQWRKYGQKMAKGNPCPRAYYRCTMATGCPVRKQVQRCADDRSILITTYEGNHNHPLPPAAMAMASTTSAAASMLLSGSMPSADGLMNSNFLTRTILPCSSSMATISASAPFPTVTLDLTHTPNPLQMQRTPASQFAIPFANPMPPAMPVPQVFGQALYNQSKFSGLQMSEPDATQFARPQSVQPPTSLVDTVSAATAAITADPNFTAALAAAITSIIGGGAHQQGNSNATGGGSFNGNAAATAAAPGSSNFPAT